MERFSRNCQLCTINCKLFAENYISLQDSLQLTVHS